MTENEVVELLALFKAARPGLKFERPTVHVYALGLADLEGDDVRQAALAWIKTNADPDVWLPTIADLRRIATMPADLPPAEEAWIEVESRYSPYQSGWAAVTSNPIAQHAAQSVFGSARFGPEAHLPSFDQWARKSFLEAYNVFADREQRDRQLGIGAGPVKELVDTLAERKRLPEGGNDE